MTRAADRRTRTNADYRWTREKVLVFLIALSRGASVVEAGRLVGMSRQSAYRLRARTGPAFAEIWQDAIRISAIARVTASSQRGQMPSQDDTGQNDAGPGVIWQGDT